MADHLARITYRPNWRFDVYEGRHEGPHLTINALLLDAENRDQRVKVRIDSSIPPMKTYDDFDEWLLWRVSIVESHECREWLRRDGRPISDPHAPDAQHDLQ